MSIYHRALVSVTAVVHSKRGCKQCAWIWERPETYLGFGAGVFAHAVRVGGRQTGNSAGDHALHRRRGRGGGSKPAPGQRRAREPQAAPGQGRGGRGSQGLKVDDRESICGEDVRRNQITRRGRRTRGGLGPEGGRSGGTSFSERKRTSSDAAQRVARTARAREGARRRTATAWPAKAAAERVLIVSYLLTCRTWKACCGCRRETRGVCFRRG